MDRTLEQNHNYNRLIKLGFSKREAEALTSTTRTLKDGTIIDVKLLDLSKPVIKAMLAERHSKRKKAIKRGIDRQTFLKKVEAPDIWDVVRDFEKRFKKDGIDTGSPPAPTTGHHKKKAITDTDIEQAKQKLEKQGKKRIPVYDTKGNIIYYQWV